MANSNKIIGGCGWLFPYPRAVGNLCAVGSGGQGSETLREFFNCTLLMLINGFGKHFHNRHVAPSVDLEQI